MANITPNRADWASAFPGNIKLQLAFEQLFDRTKSNTEAVTTGVAGTKALADATVVTLSPNDELANERVLAVDPASLELTDGGPGGNIVLSLRFPISTNGNRLQFYMNADTEVSLPTAGRLPSSADGPYANDAAAAAAGVQVGEWYAVTGGSVAWRQV